MKIYLAHPITDYGGSERQVQAVAALIEAGFAVENPDQPHHQVGYAEMGMNYFANAVYSCDCLAFMRFPDGSIGAGVGKEIKWAMADGHPIYEVFEGKVHKVDGLPTPILSVEDTRATIKRLRDEPAVEELREQLATARGALQEIADQPEVHTKLNQERLCCKFQDIAVRALGAAS